MWLLGFVRGQTGRQTDRQRHTHWHRPTPGYTRTVSYSFWLPAVTFSNISPHATTYGELAAL